MQWTTRDVARALNVPERTVVRLVADERLPAHRVNDQLRFHPAEVLDWANARGEDLAPEVLGHAAVEPATVSLADALRRGGIHRDVPGTDVAGALRAAIACMPLPPGTDPDFLWQVLLAREGQGSSSVGHGIAIPHVRNPIVLRVGEPQVTLCLLASPVDFGAPDGAPVDVLFTLVSPTVRAHLHVLSRLAHAIRGPALREALKRRAPDAEIFAALGEEAAR